MPQRGKFSFSKFKAFSSSRCIKWEMRGASESLRQAGAPIILLFLWPKHVNAHANCTVTFHRVTSVSFLFFLLLLLLSSPSSVSSASSRKYSFHFFIIFSISRRQRLAPSKAFFFLHLHQKSLFSSSSSQARPRSLR